MAGNSRKFKVALTPLRRISFKLCKKSPSPFLSYKRLKLNLRVLLGGHIVAMVTYGAAKLTAACSPMILASTDIEWV